MTRVHSTKPWFPRTLALVALSLFVIGLGAPAADAGRERELPAVANRGIDRATPPATPEPGAAVAFAVGLGVVAWAVRRRKQASR